MRETLDHNSPLSTTSHSPLAMPARSMRAFMWDLADEGLDEVVPRLRDSGFDGLHLALAYHGGRFYCAHNPRHAIVHAPDGVIYFQPSTALYESLMPRVHPQYGSGAFAGLVAERLHDEEMHFTAWVSLFTNMSLSLMHPECTCVNALGDKLEGALCPSNPDVRTYAQALIEDLATRVGADAIELENFAFTSLDSYPGAVWRGLTIEPNLGYLLGLCFCEHCRHRGEEENVEVDDLARRVARMIQSGLAGDLSDRRIGDEIADPHHPLSRYAGVRAETITSLLDELIEAAGDGAAALQPILGGDPDDAWRWGIEPHTLRERMLRATLRTCCTAGATGATIERYMELLRLGRAAAADIQLSNARCTEAELQANVESCLAAGIERFVFSHYGLIRLEMLDWVGALARN